MTKQKILMVSCGGLGKGGVQAVMMSLVRNMSDVFLFDTLLFTNDKRFYDREFLSYGGKIIRIPFYSGCNRIRHKIDYYIRGFNLFFKIRKRLKLFGPYQAIHCNNGFEAALCLWAAKSVGIPIRICHSHGIYVNHRITMKIYNSIYRFLINKFSTHRIGCSKSACQSLYGKKINTTVLNNPYDESLFDQEKFFYTKNSFFSLTQVGSFSDNKNQIFSIEVLKKIHEYKKNVVLNLIGFGDEKYIEMLKENTKLYKLEQDVHFYNGNTADIPKLLSESNAFIFPSKKEGFGIAAIEAQAMGLTCFVSDSVPKTVNVGGCVFLPLNEGASKWAEVILNTSCSRKKYDCSQFQTSVFVRNFFEIYGDCK